MWARIHLIPALQAEEDRDQVRRYLADKAREKELMGSETRVYHSDRHVKETPSSPATEADYIIVGLFGRHSLLRQRTRPSRANTTLYRTTLGRCTCWNMMVEGGTMPAMADLLKSSPKKCRIEIEQSNPLFFSRPKFQIFIVTNFACTGTLSQQLGSQTVR